MNLFKVSGYLSVVFGAAASLMLINPFYLFFSLLFAIIGLTESILEVNKGIIWYSFFNSIFAFGYLKNNHLQNLT